MLRVYRLGQLAGAVLIGEQALLVQSLLFRPGADSLDGYHVVGFVLVIGWRVVVRARERQLGQLLLPPGLR